MVKTAAETSIRNSTNRLPSSKPVKPVDVRVGDIDIVASEKSLEVLVSEIKGLTKAIEKLETRFDTDAGDIFVRLREVEKQQAVLSTKLWLLFTLAMPIVSGSISLLVYWLKSKP